MYYEGRGLDYFGAHGKGIIKCQDYNASKILGHNESQWDQIGNKDKQSVIFYRLFQLVGEAGAYLQQSMGERQGTPWTCCQSIAGQHTNNHTLIHTPKGNLERPIYLTVMFLDCLPKP
ncbi:hypothetical protein ATANTOWER_031929 [Ataeniobius toweri]|uniref:Uncharacterized protein n=1 Tax=Ataeniobius toweri TaxID=208326 RepID=A0ABU7BKX0_9TELE|nr:hypothetical protein [Ataeniobius toweri]